MQKHAIIIAALVLLACAATLYRFTGNAVLKSGGCMTDYSAIDGNLVLNPGVECDNDGNGVPDNWLKGAEDKSHILSWGDYTNHTNVLTSQFTGAGAPNSFTWYQNINSIKPDTWYEFSFEYATEDIEPVLDATNQIERLSGWGGAAVIILNSSGGSINSGESDAWIEGINLTDWDESVGVYRTYSKSSEGWKTVKKYFKMPSRASSVKIRTYNYPKGKIYFDNFVLREVPGNYDPSMPAAKSGKLKFIKYKGQDYFPIIAYGIPKNNSQHTQYPPHIDLDLIKDAGFNSVLATSYRNFTINQIKQTLVNKNLSVVIDFTLLVYHNDIQKWVNDPEHKVQYTGWNSIKSTIDRWAGFENLLAFNGPDETNEKPERDGTFIPNMKPYEFIENYIREKASVPQIINHGNPGGYTGLLEGTAKYYFPNHDIVSYTWNTPAAYPVGGNDPVMGDVGRRIKKSIAESEKNQYKPHLSMGLGVYWWSNWDGKGGWHFNQYIPFNLQRFQIWDQIINGATGVWFWGTYRVQVEDQYFNHHWKQITAISKELASLYPVLLEPYFYGEWNVSDPIDIMMKKHGGKIYVIAASTHYEDIENVTITLDRKYMIKSVRALNDVINGDVNRPVNRTVVALSGNAFTDDFTGDYGATPQKIDSPGYAVHVYEVEYAECGNGVCEQAESSARCKADCGPVCGDMVCGPGETFSICPEDCKCDSDSDCAPDGWQDRPFCMGMGVYNVWRDNYCLNHSCLHSDSEMLLRMCGYNELCSGGACTLKICGNGICESGESSLNCHADCHCGNGACEGDESPLSCPDDCHCGNGYCEGGENALSCPDDCRQPGECASGGGRPCSLDAGECAQGWQACINGGWGPCNGTLPSAETCDGKDNDCNGIVDDGCMQARGAACEDGIVPEKGCFCGGSFYAKGYCYAGVYSPESKALPYSPAAIFGIMMILALLAGIAYNLIKKDEKQPASKGLPAASESYWREHARMKQTF